MTDEIWRLSAIETAERIRAREVSALAVVNAHLDRLEAVNPKLNAVTRTLADDARAAARIADNALAQGFILGPLHGVPVTIKDNVDIAGQTSPNGVAAFKDLTASGDSPVVANLREAGAIFIGRTNTPEFSLRWHTDNELFGPTLNPWDKDVTPGGSSGGASASLAAGIGCIAHGNDLGGSLRYPAYCTGLATIRPTLGRVPAYNPTASEERPPMMTLMSVQGPIGRTVADVRLGLEVMAGRDVRDPWWVPAPAEGPRAGRVVRVALVTKPGGATPDPAVAAAVAKAGKLLSAAGFAVDEVAPPDIARCREVWGGLLTAETRAITGAAIRQYGSAQINRSLDFMEAAFVESDLEGYMRLCAERNRLLREWMAFLEAYPLIVGPVSTIPPFRAGEDIAEQARAYEIYEAQSLLVAVNLLGLPSAVVSTGVPADASDGGGGLPLGVQIIASRYREDLALAAAQRIEDAVGAPTPIDPAW